MIRISIAQGDRVEIKDYDGASWCWRNRHGQARYGTVTEIDRHCYTVHGENGIVERDVRDHYRLPQ